MFTFLNLAYRRAAFKTQYYHFKNVKLSLLLQITMKNIYSCCFLFKNLTEINLKNKSYWLLHRMMKKECLYKVSI